MSQLAYYRVSSVDQSVAAQREALSATTDFDREFFDEGVSGAVLAMNRPGFRALVDYAREGDVVHVYAIDRLGRDAIDVQGTIRTLLTKGVQLHVRGLGIVGKGVGELIVAVLAQVAEMERERIRERTAAGRKLALESLAKTGKTHRGKTAMGRPAKADAETVRTWRTAHRATIVETARQFQLSASTVKRYMAAGTA